MIRRLLGLTAMHVMMIGQLSAQVAAAEQAPSSQPVLFPIAVQGKYGYIDRTGHVAIKPQFAGAGRFSEGLAWVKVNTVKDAAVQSTYGYIDSTGARIIQPRFSEAHDFSDGLARARIGTPYVLDADPANPGVVHRRLTGRLVYLTRQGEIAFEPQVHDATDFVEGHAVFTTDGGVGHLDKTGQMRGQPSADMVGNYSEGFATFFVASGWGYIDRMGQVVIQPRLQQAGDFHEGVAAVFDGTGWGYIDPKGTMVIPARFARAYDFSESLARVQLKPTSQDKLDGGWAFITHQGEIAVVPLQHEARKELAAGEYLIDPLDRRVRVDEVDDFSDGMALVKSGHLWGYINHAGAVVIPPQFAWAAKFSGGLALVDTPNRGRGYIDKAGKFIWGPSF